MPRLMAEITEILAAPTPVNGSGRLSTRVRVRVTGPAPKGLPIPEGIVGREAEIERYVLFTYELEAGATILLSLLESRGILRPEGPEEPPPSPPGAAAMRVEADVNQDGFAEQVLGNAYLRAFVSPQHGARVSGLTVRDAGVDWLTPSYELSAEYLDIGGCEDRLGDGNGDLWKQRFAVVETSRAGSSAARVEMRHQPEAQKGLTVAKRGELDGGLPALRLETSVHYAGKGDATQPAVLPAVPEEKDRFDLSFAYRLLVNPTRAADEAPLGSELRIDMPLAKRVESLQYHRGLWCYPTSGLSLGAVALDDDLRGVGLLLLTDPALLGNVALESEGPGLDLRLRMVPEKLEPANQRTYGVLLVAGCSTAASERMVALAALAPPEDGTRRAAFVVRHVEGRGAVARIGEVCHPLRRYDWPGVGPVLAGEALLSLTDVASVTIDAGGDQLELPLRKGMAT